MKIIISLVIFCFYSFGFANAQDQELLSFKPKPKQELSLNVMSVLTKKQTRFLTDFYFRPDQQESWQVKPYINVGLLYKLEGRFFHKRVGFTYHNNKVKQDHITGIYDYAYQSEGRATGLEIRYGWQNKNNSYKKLQSTWGVDFFSGYYSQKHTVEQYSGWGGGYVGPLNVQLLTMGVSPNIGIKYFVTPAFSIGVETHISILYFKNLKDNSEKGFYGTNMDYSFPLTTNFNMVSFVEPARFIQIGYHF